MVTSESDITCTSKAVSAQKPLATDLTNLDQRIIWALHDNARKSVSDVAGCVGVSAKTVSRRLSRLVDNGLIDLHVLAVPNLDEDLISLVMVRLKPNAQRRRTIEKVRRIPGDFVDEDLSFSNAPNLIMFSLITQTISELNSMLCQIRRIEGVDSVTHDILIYQQYFETWRDRQLGERVRSSYLKLLMMARRMRPRSLEAYPAKSAILLWWQHHPGTRNSRGREAASQFILPFKEGDIGGLAFLIGKIETSMNGEQLSSTV